MKSALFLWGVTPDKTQLWVKGLGVISAPGVLAVRCLNSK